MESEMLMHLAGNVGVPAVICFYTLFELNKNFKRVADSIDNFSLEFKNRIQKLENDLRDLTIEVKTIAKRNDDK